MNRKQPPAGIILLVVLSSLTFFSVLLAAYLVFSNQSRHSSFAISARNIHRPDVNGIIDDALMTLIRGTSVPTNPFFGEDMLSDYYGRTDYMGLQVGTVTTPVELNGYVRFSLANDTSITGGLSLSTDEVNDLYTGRIITFTEGDFSGHTFRILHSISTSAGNHDVIIETKPELGVLTPAVGDSIWMNGVPRNSPGLGFDGTNVNDDAATGYQFTPSNVGSVGFRLPVALQPHSLGTNVNKGSATATPGSDFDEGYDAADFNNWFLSHQDPTTSKVIPSFHRPSVLNYILNENLDWANPPTDAYAHVIASVARSTFRPFPIAENQLVTTATAPMVTSSPLIHEQFTGGSSSFALRLPLLMQGTGTPPTLNYTTARVRLNQLMEALINGPWDVDNDFDGVADSIWVDFGLPLITAPDGKLLRPLVAPMIEDLSGRLNVNAHGNFALINQATGVNETVADWTNGGSADQFAFRGLGYGPADINIPGTAAQLGNLLQSRYQIATGGELVPGRSGADALGVLMSGWQPAALTGNGVYGNSIDPYGRGAHGLSLSGAVVPANDGDVTVFSPTDVGEALGDDPATTAFTEPTSNELADNPYELDPTGQLSSDSVFTGEELEAIIRINEFDNDLLPTRLTNLISPMAATEPDLAQAITMTSVSDDSPIVATPGSASAYDALRGLIGGTLTNAQLNDLVAPELRLAKRLNINRRFGNGIDDNGNNIVDEPREYNVPGRDDDGNGTVDDASETVGVETRAFESYASETVNGSFTGIAPNYVRDDSAHASPRQLLARHLYVLMMMISEDLQNEYPSYGDTLGTPVPVSDREAYRARRIAQWAVNVVDYRDPDAIMTRFAYDPNPFDGWAVAEDINGDGTLQPATEVFGTSATVPTNFSPVVWGCEQPDLLFSESYATHDLRVRDTNLDTDGKKGTSAPDEDDDMDQVRIPQGSLFLELYNPRRRVLAGAADPNTAGLPRELYDVDTSGASVSYSLDLARTIPTLFNGTNWGTGTASADVPVWRVGISEPHFEAADPANNPVGTGSSPLELRATLPDTQSFQPELGNPNALDELNDTAANLDLNRFVLFTSYAIDSELDAAIAPIPDMTQPAGIFFNRSGTLAELLPEQYLTLAPRFTTHFGSKVYADTINPSAPSDQRFEISSAAPSVGLIQYDAADTLLTPNTSTRVLPGLSLAISSFPPGDWTNTATTLPNGIGLNVSEPLPIIAGDYYDEPYLRYTEVAGANYPLTDAYVQLDDTGALVVPPAPLPPTPIYLDRPQDMHVDGPIKQLTQAFAADPATVADPMLGTVPNYRTAFLQRLADPTRGFHPTLNPYRTIDQIAIDLTVFSGEDTAANVTATGNVPATPPSELDYLNGSRQRTGEGIDGVGVDLLYSYRTNYGLTPQPADTVSAPMSPAGDYFNLGTNVATTFNYINSEFWDPMADAVTTPIRGRPRNPFAMHPWLNRPFATPHELMMVPACSQGRLLEEFSVIDPGNPNPPVFPENSSASTDPAYATIFLSPFRHLLNFFNSENIKATSPANAAEFSTLFDLVGTGPRYRGESKAMLPTRIAGTPLVPLYAAPFNFTEDNQRHGKLNLNSIETFAAWKGLMQGHMNPGEYSNASGAANADQLSYQSFLQTRRGYVPPNTTPVPTVLLSDSSTPVNYAPNQLDPRFPTQFAGVFRRSAEGKFGMEVRDLSTSGNDDSLLLRRRNVNAGLLRGEGTVDNQETGTGGTTPTHTPLFVRSGGELPQTTIEYQNRNKNPFLKYQTLMRMPNLASDNSQTFLIRMTVGFFEVDADDTANLGAEYGESTGQTQRYRAMFIVDRSIPVGFIPGQDLNARDTVVFERYYP
ncbi:hypothetical protein [Allorhodopirellula solitaria]|uniref:Uncharacterized protein n=1 Tax=Allorhodopirellula solitaria TaxID=2527987 RepID=A0A5C5YHG8_9BACT|nr:hypothetical protein [Allorhodopirellula solitaria]TWT74171.1 hypothetical protein CA85_10580 [Allorhodopirellula solitaria]